MESPYFNKRTTRSSSIGKVKVENEQLPLKKSSNGSTQKSLPRKRKVDVKYEETKVEQPQNVKQESPGWEPPMWREQLKYKINIYII